MYSACKDFYTELNVTAWTSNQTRQQLDLWLALDLKTVAVCSFTVVCTKVPFNGDAFTY